MSDVVTVTVSSEGQKIGCACTVLSLEINYQVNKIPYAQLTYIDADGYAGKFEITDNEAFKPGKNIKINLRYETDSTKTKTVFEGVIVQHKIKLDDQGNSLLILEMRHRAIELALSRKTAIYANQKDEDIFSKIGKNYTNIEFNPQIKSEIKHKQMVQSWCSDWDFILSRAEANGWWLVADSKNELTLMDPASRADSNITFDLSKGSTVYSLEMGIDILNQTNKISVEAWDVDRQIIITETKSANKKADFKNIGDNSDYKLCHPGNLTKEELKTWVHAKQIKNDFSLLKGKIKTSGILDIEPGMIIRTENLGKYFNGEQVVNSVRHLVNEHGFQTELGLGIAADGLISLQDVQAPSAGGLLPSIKGLHIGVVQDYEEIDKEGNQLLVKVKLPLFGSKDNEIWARLASIYAGAERGVVFRPELGDEVVLGFFNDDPRYPVILGSMYSAKNKPPIAFSKENKLKAIVTKEKMQVLFKEETKSIDLATSKDNMIIISTEGEQYGISLKDKYKNSLIFDDKGINCSSSADVKISAKKSVNIDATKVEVR